MCDDARQASIRSSREVKWEISSGSRHTILSAGPRTGVAVIPTRPPLHRSCASVGRCSCSARSKTPPMRPQDDSQVSPLLAFGGCARNCFAISMLIFMASSGAMPHASVTATIAPPDVPVTRSPSEAEARALGLARSAARTPTCHGNSQPEPDRATCVIIRMILGAVVPSFATGFLRGGLYFIYSRLILISFSGGT